MKQVFEKYVSDSYENGEFSAPDVELVGEINADDIGNKHTNTFAVVRNKIGDAAMTETLSPDLTVTDIDGGELIHTQLADKSGLVIDQAKPGLQTGWDSEGTITTIPINDKLIPLDHIGMEAQRTIEKWGKDNPEQ